MNSYQRDTRIDTYLDTLVEWQRIAARRVRDIVHAADPGVTETIKRTNRPYFVLDGNICALLGTKDHLNIFIYDPVVADPEHIINQGRNNKTARAIQLREDDTINEHALLNLFKAIIARNRTGGWRNINISEG